MHLTRNAKNDWHIEIRATAPPLRARVMYIGWRVLVYHSDGSIQDSRNFRNPELANQWAESWGTAAPPHRAHLRKDEPMKTYSIQISHANQVWTQLANGTNAGVALKRVLDRAGTTTDRRTGGRYAAPLRLKDGTAITITVRQLPPLEKGG